MRLLTPASGAVLTGGSSQRFGADKAFVAVGEDGRPMAALVLDALREGGVAEVLGIGGDTGRLAALGFAAHADDHPGEGPLGGVLTALRLARFEVVVITSCDLPALDAHTVRTLVATLHSSPDADAAVPVVDGVPQVLLAAYRRSAADPLRVRFEAGERSVRRALGSLTVVPVELDDIGVAKDVDTPEDLDRYARGHGAGPG